MSEKNVALNQHKGHVASCLCCKHLESGFEPDISDVTQGVGDYLACALDFWILFSGDETDQKEQHNVFVQGQTCTSFEARD